MGSQHVNPLHLIQAKLYQPQAGPDLVARPQLLARLDAGLCHKLTLVSAPAGFGKTTLVSQWLAASPRAAAWIALDEDDNQLPRFLRYICAAVQRAFPNTCATLQALLAGIELPSVESLAELLVEELDALPAELILVLDDYHRIHAHDVHHVLHQLLHYLPQRLHLVILTRIDPPLALMQLRVGRQLTEIRADDLRFALPETRQLLQGRSCQVLDDELIRSLQARSEGWVIGLQLAGVSLQSQSPTQFLAHFGGSDRLLTGYLLEEVISGLPPVVRECLVRLALVDRFCAPLAEALVAEASLAEGGPAPSHAIIDQLVARNLFIVALDEEGSWYRFHDLFHDFLRHRLNSEKSASERAGLHRRASVWFAQEGMIEDALRHALAAGDEAYAVDLVETHFAVIANQQIPERVLAQWLDLFTEQTISRQPGLLVVQATAWVTATQYARAAPLLPRIAAFLQDDRHLKGDRRRMFQGHFDLLQGIVLYWQNDLPGAGVHLRAALDNLPPAHESPRAQAYIYLAWVYTTSGRREASFALLAEAVAEATAHARPTRIILLGALIANHLYAGELAEAAQAAAHVLAVADDPQAPKSWQRVSFIDTWRSYAHYYLGIVCYERNDLDGAGQHWRSVEASYRQVNLRAYHESLLGLALVAQARGLVSEAMAYAHAAHKYGEELGNAAMLAVSTAVAVQLALAGGSTAAAVRLAEAIDLARDEGVLQGLVAPRLARLGALIAAASPAALAQARQLAATCLRQAEHAHNTRQVIQVLALQALAWYASQEPNLAVAALRRALALGEPGGFMRSFLDLGAPMAALLQQYAAEHGPAAYVRQLLAAFAREPDTAGRRAQAAQYAQRQDVTPLTQRELELLALVAQHLTVDEMAARLMISPNTIKKHVNSVYRKLGAKNRRQAIAKATAAGLLPEV